MIILELIGWAFLALIFLLPFIANIYGRRRIRWLMLASEEQTQIEGSVKQHSLTSFHGLFISMCVLLPVLMITFIWFVFSPMIISSLLVSEITKLTGETDPRMLSILVSKLEALYDGVLHAEFVEPELRQALDYYSSINFRANIILYFATAATSILGFVFSARLISPRFAARDKVETIVKRLMQLASGVAILTTVGIILSLTFEASRFFDTIPIKDFLFGTHWSPQIAIRDGQAGGSGAFGAIPLFAGTLMITIIAMLLAVPIGLMSAVYLSEYASKRLRNFAKPAIELLAGIPTVVYGFFAALFVAPFLRNNGSVLGLDLSSESALAAGLVMGIMIIPFISSLSDDVINSVPQNLRDGASALGATQAETIKQVILPAALPGIVSAILLAISRAIGETMIVVMAAGVAANLTANPFESVTTVTVQIVMLLVGDQEFDSAKTLAAFALGLVLFFVTLSLNVLALYIVRNYKEQYD